MAESRERVYILSEDYWGFDAASKNDAFRVPLNLENRTPVCARARFFQTY